VNGTHGYKAIYTGSKYQKEEIVMSVFLNSTQKLKSHKPSIHGRSVKIKFMGR